MEIPDHMTCLLRNLYAGQEAIVRTGRGTRDWFQIRKGYVKAVYCHLNYLTYMQSTSCEVLCWMKHMLESRLPGELSHPYMTTGKTIALTRWSLVGKVMSLLLNILSRLVITFLPRSKRLLISWLQSPLVPCKQFHQYYLSRFHIHSLIYSSFFFLFLTYFTVYNRLQIHPPHQN